MVSLKRGRDEEMKRWDELADFCDHEADVGESNVIGGLDGGEEQVALIPLPNNKAAVTLY